MIENYKHTHTHRNCMQQELMEEKKGLRFERDNMGVS